MTAKKAEEKIGKADGSQGFEKSVKRLEKIVADMEAGTLNLEDMIARFEEGQSLIKYCTKKLDEVERKVELLVKKGNTVSTKPLEDSADEPEEEDTGDPELF